jgi:hypothetical protein
MKMSKFGILVENIKAVLAYIIMATILFGPFVLAFAVAGYVENHYTVNAVVVDIEDNVYTVESPNGHQFQFTLDEDEPGKEVRLYMHTNYTDRFSDDTIEKVKFKDSNTYRME